MAIKAKVSATGFAYLDQVLARHKKAVKAASATAVKATVKPAVAQIKSTSPVKTGLLKKSIGHRLRIYDQVAGVIIGVRRGFALKITEVNGDKTVGVNKKGKAVKLKSFGAAKLGRRVNPARYGVPLEAKRGFIKAPVEAAKQAFIKSLGEELPKELLKP